MKINSRFLRFSIWAASIGLTCAVVGCAIVIGLFYAYSRDLPDPNKLANYEPPIVTRLYANNGKLLAEYATEHRLFSPLDAMPKRVIDAFLASEDKDFYKHDGVDFMSIARAIVTNITSMSSGGRMVGGSTITQQVVKNFLLTNERSFERKIKEAILAFRMDRIYSKDRILELYLNEIYLGMRSYGVAAAALNYFDKSLEELTIAEAAYLAGLPKGPANYHPERHYDRAIKRRAYVLNRMVANNYITMEESETAKAAPIMLSERGTNEVVSADFFAEEVRRKLASQYGDEVLYNGGLFVKTTVSPEYQKMADNALHKALIDYDRRHGWRGPVAHFPNFGNWQERLDEVQAKTPVFEGQSLAIVEKVDSKQASLVLRDGSLGKLPLEQVKWARKYLSDTNIAGSVTSVDKVLMVGDVVLIEPVDGDKEAAKSDDKKIKDYKLLQVPKVNGALVAMNPHTGQILAMSGGYSYLGSEFNRATQAKRQPGSAFKPFVYLAGLEAGMTPSSRINDGPISISQGQGKPNWTPKNYNDDYLGWITMRMGLEKSRNASTVYLATLLGMKRIQEIGERFGIYDKMPAHYATVLGSQETTLIRLVNAYSMLVNGGKKVTPKLIERIDDRYGKIIYRRDSRECVNCNYRDDIPPEVQKVPPQLPDNRQMVVDPASAFQITYLMQGVVERGTATRAKVLNRPLGGKTGTTNDARDAWFIGFSPDLVVGLYVGFDTPRPLGKGEAGGSVALPGFVEFMRTALKDEAARPFPMPEGVRLYKVNRWTGQPAYYGGGAGSGTIYEAFKYYDNPNSVNQPAFGSYPTSTGGATDSAYDYQTTPSNAGNSPNRSLVEGNAPASAAPAYYGQQPNRPAVNQNIQTTPRAQPEYNNRARQLQQERAARRYQNNGATGGRYNQQRAPAQPNNYRNRGTMPDNRGTGGLY